MTEVTSLEIVQRCMASGLRILDWLEDDETKLSAETVGHILDDLEILEGDLEAYIRGARDEQDAAPLRCWLESDPELRGLCRLVRSIRDRRPA